jgi:hypothetical protein
MLALRDGEIQLRDYERKKSKHVTSDFEKKRKNDKKLTAKKHSIKLNNDDFKSKEQISYYIRKMIESKDLIAKCYLAMY